jgi:hypothetical protein
MFTSQYYPDQLWDPPNHLIQWVPGALSPVIEWLEREADHSLPTSAKAKKIFVFVYYKTQFICNL